MGFRFFTLATHVDVRRDPRGALRISNYPENWISLFEDRRLSPVDPVLRASQLTSIGFAWDALPRMLRLTPADRRILAMAADQGIGDGFTVPAHIPGEFNGSCSVAMTFGEPAPAQSFPLAQLVGGFAFEGARRLRHTGSQAPSPPHLTDRQRDCVLWLARGKSDWEISRILGIQP